MQAATINFSVQALTGFQDFAGAAFRAVTATKDGPSLYDVCDPVLRNGHGGDVHLAKFYRTSLGNPPLQRDLKPCAAFSASSAVWSRADNSPIRSHIYYLPELYAAYVGRCYAAFRDLPVAARQAIDPANHFGLIRERVLAYVLDDLIAHEMNAFDAALALIALGHLDADADHFRAPLACITASKGEGGRHGPFKACGWTKMTTPIRIIVGGPEVTSAFVLMGLALARRTLSQR